MHADRSFPVLFIALAALVASAAAAPLVAQAAPTAGAVTGTFHIVWADARPGTPVPDDHRYALVDDRGRWYDVKIDAATLASLGGARALDRRRVTIDASRVLASAETGAPMPVLTARAVRLERPRSVSALGTGVSAYTVTGSQAYVTILCRFSDTPSNGFLSAAPTRAQAIMGSTSYPGVDNYYREVSNGQIDLSGSRVLGQWYTLPHPRSYYVVNNTADLGKLVEDCTGAADPDVDFTRYHGITLQFSDKLDCCSWGGSWTLDRDGQRRGYAVMWVASWGLNAATYDHEMGHSFGFPHSHGPYGKAYDSKWDIMSYAYNYNDPTWGSIGPHTIAFHKALVGWIPAARRFAAPVGQASTILIERDAQPEANAAYLVAEIPIPGTSQHYTVEARRFVGNYDSHLPGEAIVIHRCGTDATVVDPDGNGDPNDAGAQWTPGETFTDVAAKISVTVEALVGNAYRVTIRNGVSLTAGVPTLSAAAAELLGTPSLTASERQMLDDEGNADGTYNLGDFLAFAERSGQRLDGALVGRLLASPAATARGATVRKQEANP